MALLRLKPELNATNKSELNKLHEALLKLNLDVAPDAVKSRVFDTSTASAIKQFQHQYEISKTGTLDTNIIAKINNALFDQFYSTNKVRTQKVQKLLTKIKIPVDTQEFKNRIFGNSSRNAVMDFQKKAGLPVDGRLSELTMGKLQDSVITQILSTKTQIVKFQNTVNWALKVAKQNISINPAEIKKAVIGESTTAAIKSLQSKYNLPVTGTINNATYEKIQSIAVSKGTRIVAMGMLKASELSFIKRVVRLNKVSPVVNDLQKTLIFLGYKIDKAEFNSKKYGKTTANSILQYQKSIGIEQTGQLDAKTLKSLNNHVLNAKPNALTETYKHRVRGSVLNTMWQKQPNMVIRIYEKTMGGESEAPLATKMSHTNGFFDITYAAPLDPVTKKVKDTFHLVVKLFQPKDTNPANDLLMSTQTHFNVTRIHWVNFNLSVQDYMGDSDFEQKMKLVSKSLGAIHLEDIKETENNKQVTQLSLETGLDVDSIMQLYLSAAVAKNINQLSVITTEVIYVFIRQNLPPGIPGDLMRATNGWNSNALNSLIETASTGIVFCSSDIQNHTIDCALNENIVTQSIRLNKNTIITALGNLRTAFTLSKPILTGNVSLATLLTTSGMTNPQNDSAGITIANEFAANNGFTNNFWKSLDTKVQNQELNGGIVKNFYTTVDLGVISKNHVPTLSAFKANIGSGSQFQQVSDIAKLNDTQIADFIKANGSSVPDNIPGNNLDDKITTYSKIIQSRAESLFPGVAMVAAVKRTDNKKFTQINSVESFVDQHQDYDMKSTNLDKYLSDAKKNNQPINLDKDTVIQIKAIQRVSRVVLDSIAGSALLNEGLHSSFQIYSAGKDGVTNIMLKYNVPNAQSVALSAYEKSKILFLQVWHRYLQFNSAIGSGTPKAISNQAFSTSDADVKQIISEVPDLESLFGSLDYCDCSQCKSLYGPSAYFVDLLRFLKQHNSNKKSNGNILTVKDILFERRADLGDILLNCDNTNTPLPYIDLACEILEKEVLAIQAVPVMPDATQLYQSTASAQELRALPQWIQSSAYDILATADYPISSSFNLWQEETRTYLNYLRVPRFSLMKTFQNRYNVMNMVPADGGIAAEFFNISFYENDIITTKRDNSVSQNIYWGFDTTQTKIPVRTFMMRTKLSYNQVIDLLNVKFVNPESNKSVIDRPVDSCDTNVQNITNLTIQKIDLFNRFLRLWNKAGFEMWQLDLLLRNGKIGVSNLDASAVTNIQKFRQLQDKLKLPFEVLLAFFGEMNREVRIDSSKPQVLINPLYNNLFQNKSITNPIDSYFKAIQDVSPFGLVNLDSAINLETNPNLPYNGYSPVQTISSALAISQSDFNLLKGFTNNHLSVDSLSILMRYAYLAKSLKLSIKDFILLLGIFNSSVNLFNTPQTTLDFIENFELIKVSGFSLNELDYILNYNSLSPIGLRDETLNQLVADLRKIIFNNKLIIEQLGLSDGDRNTILNFNANSLFPLSNPVNPTLHNILLPLVTVLNSAYNDFIAASFSVNETQAIIYFDVANANTSTVTGLIVAIKQLQQNLNNLLNQNENQIKAQVANAFKLADDQTGVILSTLTLAGKVDKLIVTLSNNNILDKKVDGSYVDINSTNYLDQFNVYILLHKISVLLKKMPMDTEDLNWFITNCTSVNTLNFSALPVANGSYQLFTSWLNLYKFLDFKSRHPEPDANTTLRAVLTLAITPLPTPASLKTSILTLLSNLTNWNLTDLAKIDLGLQFTIFDGGNVHITSHLYNSADTYKRLQDCFDQIKLIGSTADNMFKWALIFDDSSPANLALLKQNSSEARQAVKAKLEDAEWLATVTPLYDSIREKKRDGLVAYLLENSQRNQPDTVTYNLTQIPNTLYWSGANDLFNYFLIDVEMCSCQLTSRIKQAISSLQFFVQRCYLNLELPNVEVSQADTDDKTSPNAWSQWKWMKSEVLWEANRKVFFYPENWIEPELRDDKSPFFEEFEKEILQNEITNDNVEAAFLNYLHKVDEVANLEVVGLYHEMENLNADTAGYEINIAHVIGRTKAVPHIYYYRKYNLNYLSWSSWEKIDLDIMGDQLVPVVYNRKLHLFWLVFVDKPMKVKKVPPAKPDTSSQPKDVPEPMKQLEIQLAWSIKKNNGWSSKKISKQKLIHPWERPHFSYNLRPYYYSAVNELYLDIYLSTSQEFNDTKFYDPYVTPDQAMVYLTNNRFNETLLPWHSSSFVFDGHIKSVEIKPLKGAYRILQTDGTMALTNTDSFNFVNTDFGEIGKEIAKLDVHEFGPRLRLPGGMHFKNTVLTNNQHDSVNNNQLRILENNATVTLLAEAANPFNLIITQQDLQLNTIATDHPVFYQDNVRSFFIKPEWQARIDSSGIQHFDIHKYYFYPFYHPYTTLFIRELNRSGVEGIYQRSIQTNPQKYIPANSFHFNNYQPASNVVFDLPDKSATDTSDDIVDFSYAGAYSIYNWELFFHAPYLLACKLSQNQKFEDALRWFHFIFNPSDIEKLPAPNRFWLTKPFYDFNSDDYRAQTIQSILSNIDLPVNHGQLVQWRNNPFEPFVIARLRPVAFQKNVVMKYLNNLIAWGDQLFAMNTIESINQASLLYILGYQLLGPKPIKVPSIEHDDFTFNQLEAKGLDDFGNASVDVVIENNLLPISITPSTSNPPPMPGLDTSYFCIPNNDKLTKYWDTLEDRLYKIRHCMNIQGLVQQLPLFDPPIDPALLVKAAAAGMDLSSVLSDLSAPTPLYRFKIVVQKAIDFCNDVRMLGEKLLSVLEKNDAEGLSLLRSQYEIEVLEAIKELKSKQIDEAVQTIGSLNKSLDAANKKKEYYDGIPRMNDWEIGGTVSHGLAIVSEIASTVINIFGGSISMVPDVDGGGTGVGGSPTVKLKFGGTNFGNAASKIADFLKGLSSILHSTGSMLETQGSYTRRHNENVQQSTLAGIEIDQIQFQINAAQIRQEISETDFDNQQLQIDNAKSVDDFLRNKYTSQQLYSWMITQISTVYFQAYQLAYQMAKKAEKCFQYELGIENSSYIQFGYWDSLKKGMLSGDKLMNDLRTLDAAYIDQNKRQLEITKHISFAQMFPSILVDIKEIGQGTLSLPEWLFDMDYPGHYRRRIKSVSISIPCIVGPYTNVNCTLSLMKNKTRIVDDGNYDDTSNIDSFNIQYGQITSIATSNAQLDSGMFTLDFNDERFLPFEGAGVISDWLIKLPKDNNFFDFDSISDIVLHINYTSQEGSVIQSTNARTNLATVLPNSGARLFSLKYDFPNEWFQMFNPLNNTDKEMIINLRPEHFPYFLRRQINSLKIKQMDLFVESDNGNDFLHCYKVTDSVYVTDIEVTKWDAIQAPYDNVYHIQEDANKFTDGSNPITPKALGEIKIKFKINSSGYDYKSLTNDQINDCYLLLQLGL